VDALPLTLRYRYAAVVLLMSKRIEDISGDALLNRVVSFYLPERQALAGMDPLTIDPDREWAIFGTGVYVWILQTFLRLRVAGAPVRLVETPPAAGQVVVHADHFARMLSEADSPADLTIVVARSDRGPQPLADFGVVQNAASADHYHFFIPSWLQPGLVPRTAARGTRVEEIAYVGAIKELDPDLASAAWVETLRERGLRWDSRTIAFAGNDQVYSQLRWNDYSTTDVVVALRAPSSWNVRSKPAAKLQNAWAAGVPAILSPEAPYRELRRSPLDYLEARSSADVLAAIDVLRSNPSLYSDMVQNGLERARDFRPDRLVARWVDVLWREIPERAGTPRYRLMAKSRRCRALARRLRHRLTSRPTPL
jgi:hypothetical protein